MGHDSQQQILQLLMNQIRRYLRSLGATEQDAEDITQDTLIKVLLYIDAVPETEFRAIAFKSALNRYYDHCRKKNRNVTVMLDERVLTTLKQYVSSAENAVLAQEKSNEVQQALETLPTTKKHLLLMKYEMGLSYEEIASLIGTSVSTVKTTLYRARNQLKMLIQEDE